jgi:hypothetical protein
MSKYLAPKNSSKLYLLSFLQFAVIVIAFSAFFYVMGLTLPISLFGGVLVFCLIYVLFQFLTLPFFIFPQIKGPVYVPSADEKIDAMIQLLALKPKDRVVDLGSGDGRIIIALAKKGVYADGFELNPILVQRSEQNIKDAGVSKKAHAYWKSFWDIDLSQYTAVTLYGIPYIMKDLEKKLLAELPKGARVASNAFTFPNWKPKKVENNVSLYVK